MKYLILFASLLAVGYGLTSEQVQMMKKQVMAFGEGCQADVGANANDITEIVMRRSPKRQEGKCFLFCMHKKIGFQNDAGKVDVPRIQSWLADLNAMDPAFGGKMKQIADYCIETVNDGGESCDNAVVIFECYVKKSKEMNIQMMF